MKKRLCKLVAPALALSIALAPFTAVDTLAAREAVDGDVYAGESNGSSSNISIVSSTSGEVKASRVYSYDKIKNALLQYQEINSDVKGWLIVPNTNINFPILQGTASNKDYEERDWKGTQYPGNNHTNYRNTASYLDYRARQGDIWKTKETSRNIVIYGHNWTNLRAPLAIGQDNDHIMFGQLPSYTDIKFARENPYIYYSTDKMEGVWKVFAVAYAEVDESFYYNFPNYSKDGVNMLAAEWKDRSMFDFSVDVNENDRLLTLSTCTRQNAGIGAGQRFVVVARLLRPEESETDAVTVSVNQDMKQPNFTVTKK